MLKKYTWRKVSVVLEKSFCKPRVPPHAGNLDAPKKKSRGRGREGEGSWCSQKRGERGNCRKDKVPRSFLKEVDFSCCCCAKGGGAVFFGKWRGGRQKGQLPNDLWRLLRKRREGRGKLDVAAAVRHRLDKENNPYKMYHFLKSLHQK